MKTVEEMNRENARTYEVVGALYDSLLAYRTTDLPYWRDLARRYPGFFAEMGCGTGRILRAVDSEAEGLIGVDSSAEMLGQCEIKLRGSNFTPVLSRFEDLPALPVQPSIVAFTLGSLQYCLGDRVSVLRRMRSLLPFGGCLVLDAKNFVADPKFREAVDALQAREPYTVSYGSEEIRVEETVSVDSHTMLVEERVLYTYASGRVLSIEQYMQALTLGELRALCDLSGFEVCDVRTSYQTEGQPRTTGQRIIVEARAV